MFRASRWLQGNQPTTPPACQAVGEDGRRPVMAGIGEPEEKEASECHRPPRPVDVPADQRRPVMGEGAHVQRGHPPRGILPRPPPDESIARRR